MTGSILALAVATLAFVGGHFLLSHFLRVPLRRIVGEKAFPGAYSLLVGSAFVWMLFAYGAAPYVELWGKAEWMRWPLIVLMLPASMLLVAGVTAPNPLLVGGEGRLVRGAPAVGIFAVTRHPANWGFAIWALGHLVMNGDLATVILTGGIAVLALLGSRAQEARKAAELGEAWCHFAAATSFVPLVAILEGRASTTLDEIGYWRLLVGILLWVMLLNFHGSIIGVSALPG